MKILDMKIVIGIPAYNEGKNIAGILDLTLFSVAVAICIITTVLTPIIAKPLLKKITT